MTRIVVAAVFVGVTTMVPGGAESSAREPAGKPVGHAALTYVCPFPSREQKITVKIAGAFPATSAVGHDIRLGSVTMTPILPRAALADLTALGATSVAASARMSVTVAQKGSSVRRTLSSLTASSPIPGSGGLALPGSATVPPIMSTKAGPVVFIAGALRLILTPHKADGSATNSVGIPLDCRLELGPNVVLATVLVTGPAGAAAPATPGAGTTKGARRTARVRPDDDSCPVSVDLPPVPGEAYMAGFSNVNKLNGATLLGVEDGKTTGHILLELAYEVIFDPCASDSRVDILSRGTLDHRGEHALPPAKATFLTFGFMPTTATLELSEPPGTDIEIDSHSFFDGTSFPEISTVTSQLSIRVRDALANGKPLDVGAHCESATPMAVKLTGKSPDYTVNTGGPLTGTATIPPFSGCGVGEDLDPLLNASISGPGNFMKLTQGVPCTYPVDGPPLNCDPIDRPKPQP